MGDTHVEEEVLLLAAQRVAQSLSVKVGWREKRQPDKAVSRATPGPSGLVVEAKVGLVGALGLSSQKVLHMLWTLVAFQFFFRDRKLFLRLRYRRPWHGPLTLSPPREPSVHSVPTPSPQAQAGCHWVFPA
jgi:hypothetical protein